MFDNCKVGTYTSGSGALNSPLVSYSFGNEIPCSYDPVSDDELVMDDQNQVRFGAMLRLPLTTVVNPEDHIQITKRSGVSITPLEFEVMGEVMKRPTVIYVPIRRVYV